MKYSDYSRIFLCIRVFVLSYICYKGDENDNKKVLNNNAALAVNSSGKEIIVMGKGLAFQKKKRGFH